MDAAGEMRELIRIAERQGWTKTTSGKHVRLHPPPDRPEATSLTVPVSPGDVRSVRNSRAEFRRAGVNLDDPRGKKARAAARASARVNTPPAAMPIEAVALVRQDPATEHGLAALRATREETPTMPDPDYEMPADLAGDPPRIDPGEGDDPPEGWVKLRPQLKDRYNLTFTPAGVMEVLSTWKAAGPKGAYWVDPEALDRAPLYELGRAAEYAGRTRIEVDHAAKGGLLPSTVLGSRERRFSPCDLRTWAVLMLEDEEGAQEPPAEAAQGEVVPKAVQPSTAPSAPAPEPVTAPTAPEADRWDFRGRVIHRRGDALLVEGNDGKLYKVTEVEL